jgi:hypothetical protein
MGNRVKIMDNKNLFDECADDGVEEYLQGEVKVEEVSPTEPKSNGTEINEELVEVIFSTIKSSFKVNLSGNLVFFRFEFISDRSLFTLRVRKSTFVKFFEWMSRINEIITEDK